MQGQSAPVRSEGRELTGPLRVVLNGRRRGSEQGHPLAVKVPAEAKTTEGCLVRSIQCLSSENLLMHFQGHHNAYFSQ